MAATVTHRGTTWNTTAGNKTVTATPAVGDLIVIIAPSTGVATSAISDTQSGSYVQVDSTRTGFSTSGNLTVWVRTTPISSATSTTWTATQTSSTGGGLSVLSVSGMSVFGSSAVRSSGGQSSGTSGTTPAPVLSLTPLSANPIIAAVCNSTNGSTTVTPRSGYTEDNDSGYNTPATGLEVSHLASGETSATLTFGSTTASAFASVAIELAYDTSPTVALNSPPTDTFSVSSASATSFSTSVTSMAVNLSSSSPGDLLIALVSVRNSGTWSTIPTGWTQLFSPVATGGVGDLTAFYKTADGTESSTATWIASTGTTGAWQVRTIKGWHGTTAPEAATANSGGTPGSNIDSPSLTPSWGSDNTIWLSVGGAAAESITSSAGPSGYSDSTWTNVSAGGSSASVGSAYKHSTGSSEDPGNFTTDASRWWYAATIGIRPAQVLSDSTPELDFTGTDAESDAITYEVQVDMVNTFDSNVIDSFSDSNSNGTQGINSAISGYGQTFHGSNATINSAQFYLKNGTGETGSVSAKIYAMSGSYGSTGVPTGSALASSTSISGALIPTTTSPITFSFPSPLTISSGTDYVLTLEITSSNGTGILIDRDSSSPTHGGNISFFSGGSWGSPSGATNAIFTLYSTSSLPLDKLSASNAGFTDITNGADTDPFTSGDHIGFTVQAGDALANGTYYWRVRGKDPSGTNSYGSWSSTRSFTVSAGSVLTTTQSAIARIATNITKTQGATARIQRTLTKTQSAVARVANVITKTQSAISRVANTLTKTQGAVARVATNRTKTQTAVASIQKVVTKTQSAVARISQTTTKTQSAVSRVANTITKTQPAKAAIVAVVTKTQTALARIANTETKTQSATARIATILTKTQASVARIANVETKTQPAVSRIAVITTKTQGAISRVANTLTKTQSAVANIVTASMNTKTQPAVARIATNLTKTQSSIARISTIIAKTQSALARISQNYTKTQAAIARIAIIPTKTQSAISRIATNLTKTQAAKASIVGTVTKTQSAVARIALTLAHTQPAISRIATVRTKTQGGIARIATVQTLTQTATANITSAAPLTKTQTAIARIAVNRTLAQSATARVATNLTKAQSSTARIAQNYAKTQSATSRISVLLTKTQSALAHIAAVQTKTQPALADIATTVSKTISATARIFPRDVLPGGDGVSAAVWVDGNIPAGAAIGLGSGVSPVTFSGGTISAGTVTTGNHAATQVWIPGDHVS